MNCKITLLNYLLTCIFIFTTVLSGYSQTETGSPDSDLNLPKDEASLQLGEELFVANCQRCHFICKQSLGPSLAGVNKRRRQDWLIRFIKNSQQVITSGDPYAQHLADSYTNATMPDFEHLSADEIKSILSYIDERTVNTYDSEVQNSTTMRDIDIDIEDPQKSRKVDYYTKTTDLKIPDGKENVVNGKQLFIDQCKECHDLCVEKIGPPLATVTDRRPLPWLMDFIENPQKVLEQGDEYALYLWSQYDLVMTQAYIDKQEILDVLAYIRHESGSPVHVSGTNSPNSYEADSVPKEPAMQHGEDVEDQGDDPREVLTIGEIALMIIVVMTIAVFAFFLIKIYRNLHRGKSKNE